MSSIHGLRIGRPIVAVGLLPYRQLIGSPLIVWEFNTVPEYGALIGRTEREIQSAIQALRRYGRGCDLAICVSSELAAYVKEKLGIRRVLVVPNGSDPDLFRPDVEPVSRVQRNDRQLNVVWIGSAYLSWHNFDLSRQAFPTNTQTRNASINRDESRTAS